MKRSIRSIIIGFLIFFVLVVLVVLVSCSCSSNLAKSQARMSNAITNLINRVDKIYQEISAGQISWEEAVPRLDKLSSQLAGLNLYLEYSEAGYGGYRYSRGGERVMIKTNFTSPNHTPQTPANYGAHPKIGTYKGCTIVLYSDGGASATGPGVKKPGRLHQSLGQLLVWEFGASEINPSAKMAKKIKWQ